MIAKSLSDEQLISLLPHREVKNSADVNLKTTNLIPYAGGLYDPDIFGSIGVCRPSCGRTTKIGVTCASCGGVPITKKEADDRFAYYQMSYPMIHQYKVEKLIKKLLEISRVFSILSEGGFRKPSPKSILFNIWNLRFKVSPISREERADTPEYQILAAASGKEFRLDVVPFDPDDNGELEEYGPIGLYTIIRRYKTLGGKSLDDIRSYVNTVFVISPASLRAIKFKNFGSRKEAYIPKISGLYKALITYDQSVSILFRTYTSNADRLCILYTLNKLINCIDYANELLQPSKQSAIRNSLSARVPRSGRTNITGDPNLPIDTVLIPRSLAYEILKSDVLKWINKKYPFALDFEIYRNPTKEVLEYFEELAESSVVVINRNPSLHKYSMQAFKVKLHDEITMSIPLLVTSSFGADFDGDQMAFYFITESPIKEDTFAKMNPAVNWIYDRNDAPVFVPDASILYGLYLATRRVGSKETVDVETFAEAEKLFTDIKIEVDDVITVDDRRTTYGREKISDILGVSLDSIIGSDDPIKASNIGNIMAALGSMSDKIDKLQRLQKFALEVNTMIGATSISMEDLYHTKDHKEQVEKILHSNRSDKEKLIALQEEMPKIIKDTIAKLPDTNLADQMKGGHKLKVNQMIDIAASTVSMKDGKLEVEDTTLAYGAEESTYVKKVINNRNILNHKKTLVPTSGYLTRQFVDLGFDVQFKADELSNDTVGILLPKRAAVGRETMNSELIKDNDSDELVRVKSFATSPDDDVHYGELNVFKEMNPEDMVGSKLGISYMSSLTDFITQNSLSLKHGGSLTTLDTTSISSEESAQVMSIERNILTLKTESGKIVRYYYPRNVIFTRAVTENKIQSGGTKLFYMDKEYPIDYNLASLIKLVSTFNSIKTKVKPKVCYSPTEGKISYDVDNRVVHIGSFELPLYSDEIYFYKEGTEISLGMRICTGLLSLPEFAGYTSDEGLWYLVFFKQFSEIFGKKINSELLEILFKRIKNKGFSVRRAIKDQGKFIAEMLHGYNTKGIMSKYVDEDIGSGFVTSMMLNKL